MLNFDFLEKGLEIVSPPHFVYDFSRNIFLACYILLNDKIPLSNWLYFLRYLGIYALQLIVSQILTS